jgi:E3 ubiquitin-protein ligase RNF14
MEVRIMVLVLRGASLSCHVDELRGLRDEYISASAEGKKFMEQRFGKRVIQRAVEESFSRDWLYENCKGCPRCGTNIQVCCALHKKTVI